MYWLGIDIGSISTDFVLIDDNFEIKKTLYLKTKSKPVEAIKAGLSVLGREYMSEEIGGTGLTGSGRSLGAAVVGGDIVKNEITAHARAVAFTDSEIQTVIEIGGQDSKIIIMKDGLVEDFAMNTVCAAGTGSFLDRQAGRMGITIEELGNMAAGAESFVSIAGRCAVFAESDIIHKQQKGAKEDELMAGMCRALALSFMSNVAKGKKIRPKVCFQGGVAANLGMKKAFEDIIGHEVIVPKEHKVMGALGAAVIAKEKSTGKTKFNGFELALQNIMLNEKNCTGCANRCGVTKVYTDGNVCGYFGDRCGRYSG